MTDFPEAQKYAGAIARIVQERGNGKRALIPVAGGEVSLAVYQWSDRTTSVVQASLSLVEQDQIGLARFSVTVPHSAALPGTATIERIAGVVGGVGNAVGFEPTSAAVEPFALLLQRLTPGR